MSSASTKLGGHGDGSRTRRRRPRRRCGEFAPSTHGNHVGRQHRGTLRPGPASAPHDAADPRECRGARPSSRRQSWRVARRSRTRADHRPSRDRPAIRDRSGINRTNRSACATASASDRSPIAPHAWITASAASSSVSSAIGRRDDHTPVRIVTLGAGRDPSTSLSASWTILRSADDIGSSTPGDAGLLDLVGHLHREPIEGLLAALAISADVDAQASVVVAEATLRCDAGEILHRLRAWCRAGRPAGRGSHRAREPRDRRRPRSIRWCPVNANAATNSSMNFRASSPTCRAFTSCCSLLGCWRRLWCRFDMSAASTMLIGRRSCTASVWRALGLGRGRSLRGLAASWRGVAAALALAGPTARVDRTFWLGLRRRTQASGPGPRRASARTSPGFGSAKHLELGVVGGDSQAIERQVLWPLRACVR